MLTLIRTGSPVAVWNGHQNWVLGIAITSDGRYALSASGDGTLRLWNLAILRLGDVHRMKAVCVFSADDALSTCTVSPDSRTILVGDHAGQIHRLRLREPSTWERPVRDG